MHHVRSEIEIAATPDKVRAVLTDFPSYESWNPFVRRISNERTSDARLSFMIQPDGGNQATEAQAEA